MISDSLRLRLHCDVVIGADDETGVRKEVEILRLHYGGLNEAGDIRHVFEY